MCVCVCDVRVSVSAQACMCLCHSMSVDVIGVSSLLPPLYEYCVLSSGCWACNTCLFPLGHALLGFLTGLPACLLACLFFTHL